MFRIYVYSGSPINIPWRQIHFGNYVYFPYMRISKGKYGSSLVLSALGFEQMSTIWY